MHVDRHTELDSSQYSKIDVIVDSGPYFESLTMFVGPQDDIQCELTDLVVIECLLICICDGTSIELACELIDHELADLGLASGNNFFIDSIQMELEKVYDRYKKMLRKMRVSSFRGWTDKDRALVFGFGGERANWVRDI